MKMGFGWLLYKKNQDWFRIRRVTSNLTATLPETTLLTICSVMLPTTRKTRSRARGNWNNVSWSTYFQDNYRVTNRLTLNLGLRWDGIPHTYEASNNMANFYPSLYDPAKAAIIIADGAVSPSQPRTWNQPGSRIARPVLCQWYRYADGGFPRAA